MDKEWLDAATIVYNQLKETVVQESSGITVRMGLVTCPCGRKMPIVNMYKCLYCKVFMCDCCAEEHFGKTVKQYKQEKAQRVTYE